MSRWKFKRRAPAHSKTASRRTFELQQIHSRKGYTDDTDAAERRVLSNLRLTHIIFACRICANSRAPVVAGVPQALLKHCAIIMMDRSARRLVFDGKGKRWRLPSRSNPQTCRFSIRAVCHQPMAIMSGCEQVARNGRAYVATFPIQNGS